MITLPEEVGVILSVLEQNGYEGYAVGGCVRDSLLGTVPDDWDVCTSAAPERMTRIFSRFHLIETGLKHGTVTVIVGSKPIEVTAYRRDGTYTDRRRPDAVTFVGELETDLSRRDFTVNAMAWHPRRGLADPFGGREDLKNRVLRCVGDPGVRFNEDALRILRALRFAAVLGFAVEERTAEAIVRDKALLRCVAPERAAAELNKLLPGKNAAMVLRRYAEVLREIAPEIEEPPDMDGAPPDIAVRLALLLGGRAKEALTRLRYDRRTISEVSELVSYRDMVPSVRREDLLRYLNRLGETQLRRLFALKGMACPALLDELLAEKACCSLKDLAVRGHDLTERGFTGKDVGDALSLLLDAVIDGKVPNERESLLAYLSAAGAEENI